VDINAKAAERGLTIGQVADLLDGNHAHVGQLATFRKELAMLKARAALPYLLELIESEPLVIFSSHPEAIEYLADELHPGLAPVIGATDAASRSVTVSAFKEGKCKAICGTIGPMGTGLTLTQSHHVVFIDRDWRPSLNQQAEDRVCRIGQQHSGVLVTDIVSDSAIDEHITETLIKKQRIIEASVEQARTT
jgi:SNF2 family DNA or RNA helicase